ncbi:MAG: PrsW family intramembrane metalloprotease [Eubacterium sp.]|nr:PrsW family intramembrane metalloprotease [Eubacterium sp.]
MNIEASPWMIILVAVLPAVIMMVYIYLQDNHEKEPIGLLLGIFGFGILSAIPAILLEFIAEKVINITFGGTTLIYYAVTAFFGVAIIEEGVKFMAAYLLTWRNRHFNYKFDGIVYCLFGSMGFAAIENVMYLLMENKETALTLGIQRGILAIPCHGMCAIFMGYYYGNAKYAKSYGDRAGCRKNLFIGFMVASSLHAFYDFCLFTQSTVFFILFIIFVVVADVFTLIRIHKAKKTNQKMYEAPKFRQYWVNANPYQSYGGYQAPAYGAYAYGSNQGLVQNPQANQSQSSEFVQPQYGDPNSVYRPNNQVNYQANPASAYSPYRQADQGMAQGYGQPDQGMAQGYGQPDQKTPYFTETRPKYEPQVVATKQEYKPEVVGQNKGMGLDFKEDYNQSANTYHEPDYSSYYNNGQIDGGQNQQGQPFNNQSADGQVPNGNQGQNTAYMAPSSMRGVQIHCPVCGEINNFNAFYCKSCGASLHQIK